MAVVDQKERYRRQAALCYEIATKMAPKKAASMVRLGDTYSALAVERDRRAPNIFVATKRLEQPHCKVCGRKMRLACALPRTRTLPSMQAFRCDRCGETLIWKSASPTHLSTRAQSTSTAHPEGSPWTTRYVAVSLRRLENRFSPGEAIECPDARLAVRRAQLMMREKETVGSVAFSRRSNAQTGEVEAAKILTVLGTIPDGFDIA
jgi:hypothetical protein